MTTQKNKEVTFFILQKNMRSMHSSEKIEELVSELEGYRWDAILLNETWRHAQAEIWDTHHKPIFMVPNKRWRKRINKEYINERAITTHDLGEPSTQQVDECVLSPLKKCESPH